MHGHAQTVQRCHVLRCGSRTQNQRLPRRTGRQHLVVCKQQVVLSWGNGRKETLQKDSITLGRQADVQLSSTEVLAQHVKLEVKGGRVFCTALSGDPDDFLSPTQTWLNGDELRPGVPYMVTPGSTLAIGTLEQSLTVDFTEQGGSETTARLLMQAMAGGASQEVKQQIDKL